MDTHFPNTKEEVQEAKLDIKLLSQNLKDYVNARYELVSLKVIEKTSDTIPKTVSVIIAGVLSVIFLLFISIAAAWYIGMKMGAAWEGFAIVAGAYLLFTIILMIFKEQIVISPIRNVLVKQFLGNK